MMQQAAAPSSGLQVKPHAKLSGFSSLISGDNFKKALATTLPKSIKVDKFIRVTLAAMSTNPKIFDCTPESVLLSLMRAASMGLEPDGGPLGQGYLVPYGRECQFIAGYRGLVKLARNSGEVEDVWAEAVYAKDKFDYDLGVNPTLTHKRDDESEDPGPLKYVYAVALFRSGHRKFIVMNKREVTKAREMSQSKDSQYSPWKNWEGEMWKKTAVRRLCKLLPMEVEAIERLAGEEADPTTFVTEGLALLPEASPEDGKKKVAKKAAQPEPEPQGEVIDAEPAVEQAAEPQPLEGQPEPQPATFHPVLKDLTEYLNRCSTRAAIDKMDAEAAEQYADELGPEGLAEWAARCMQARDQLVEPQEPTGNKKAQKRLLDKD